MLNAGQVSSIAIGHHKSQLVHHIENYCQLTLQTSPTIIIEPLSDMSGGAKRKTVPAKLDLTEEQKVTKLGQLMNESHASCDQLYDCSST